MRYDFVSHNVFAPCEQAVRSPHGRTVHEVGRKRCAGWNNVGALYKYVRKNETVFLKQNTFNIYMERLLFFYGNYLSSRMKHLNL